MRDKEKIQNNREQAISVAENLGHKIKKFERYDNYYSSFCARCSAYLQVTADEFSGRAVEDICQQLCSNCRKPLTNDDLDGICLECRGNKLTLYPKTPSVRQKNSSFNEYCRKGNPDYEPSVETTSDFYSRCQSCARRLGNGYQGEPDERGYCQSCINSEISYAKRKAEAIEAAGGIKIWKYKRLINKILTPIDYIAIIIVFISIAGCVMVLALSILKIIFRLLEEIPSAWTSNNENRIIIIIVLLAVIWCAIRWKHLNKRPSPWDNDKE